MTVSQNGDAMNRSSNEDGMQAGWRNVGRLALWTIPLSLGLAGSVWLGFYIGVHDFRRELSQEDRAAIVVGAEVRPKGKMKITIETPFCVSVTRADLDGSALRLYAKNDCHQDISYLAWYYALVAPNGTVLHEGYTNSCAVPRHPTDLAECVFDGYSSLTIDDRAASIRVWTMGFK
jgi:hypothetical protein